MTLAAKKNNAKIDARTEGHSSRDAWRIVPDRLEYAINDFSADSLDTVLSAIREAFARLDREGARLPTIDNREQADHLDDVRLTFSGTFVTAARNAAMREPTEMLARVLVVEDNPIAQLITSQQLRELGCIACTATSGAAALKALAIRHFDLVLLDCRMPEIDGYQTAREIRRLEENGQRRRVTIVAVTGDSDVECVDKCMSSGMDGHLSKPTSAAALRMIFSRFLT